MKVAVILGYRLNDDGTMAKRLVERLNLTLELIKELNPDRVILSGGVANPLAKVSEAQRMEEYLVAKGVNPASLIKEEQSLTTAQNARFSVPIAKALKADTIVVCSSIEHFTEYPYNIINYFRQEIGPDQITLMTYTKTTSTTRND
ncbi:MAG TPA: YdcF family protein [Bacilli bacterium]|jgi:uncharacterized SAM-binding protein YcdF (DUF218 family)|nr:YdcF family protein [Acholeplasmataceae bacterium]OQB65354.1 MAG: hypothetical protein BWX94_00348 [Tenericutes bacterium ADurb.Bin140]HON64640.1 YdcF family protein [Bacilli bacterium]HPK58006.1 YdcF family protein [Bacilli bacterium]HPN90529.1 YdcF family protein [Bacilli bacterium]